LYKKISVAVAALLLAICMSLTFASPASASQTQCRDSSDTAVLLCAVFSKDAGGTGFTLDKLIGSCKPYIFGTEPVAGWDDIAIDGHGIQVWKWDSGVGNQVQKVNITDSNSNVHLDSGGDHACIRTWQIDQHWPDMNTMLIRWDFTEQKNHASDVSDVIQMSFTNAG
jgi:hypothetical protein